MNPCWLWACLLGSSLVTGFPTEISDLYGTFHSVGVTVDLDSTDDPSFLSTGQLWYKLSTDTEYTRGHDFTALESSYRYVSSLFQMDAGTTYDIQVLFVNGPIDAQTLTGSVTTRAESELDLPTSINSYYASPDGTGDCTSETTPCTLATALSSVSTDEEIILLAGTYYTGDMSIPSSDIVIRGVDESTVILNGAFETTTWEWTVTTDDTIWEATVVGLNAPQGIIADDQRLFPYDCLDTGCELELSSLGLAEYSGFYYEGTTLYVKFTDSSVDPNAMTIEVPQYAVAFNTNGQSNIQIRDITFQNYGDSSYPKAIYIDTSSDVLIDSCTFKHNQIGVGIKRECDNVVVQNCNFIDSRSGFKWESVKAAGNLEAGGLAMYSSGTEGRGLVIRYNTFYDYFDCLNPGASDTASGNTHEMDVYHNDLLLCSDDAISMDGTCSNCRVWDNYVYKALAGISLAPIYDGPIFVFRNVMHYFGFGDSNTGYTGVSFKFNSGYDPSGVMYIYHNTIDARPLPSQDGCNIKNPGDWEQVYFRNNIFIGTDFAMANVNSNPVDADYDCFWTNYTDGFYWLGSRYSTLTELHATYSDVEQNAVWYLPTFTDSDNGDYTLASTDTDIIDAAEVIYGINNGYSGVAPDIGAFELGDTNDVGNGGGDIDIPTTTEGTETTDDGIDNTNASTEDNSGSGDSSAPKLSIFAPIVFSFCMSFLVVYGYK